VEDCILEQSNGSGISFLSSLAAGRMNITLRNCEMKDNGQAGFHGDYINGLLMEGCVISGNNAKNFSVDWGGCGGKFLMCRDIVFDHCVVSKNRGPGIWIDFGNEEVEVKNCLLIENGTTGLYYEASYTLHAHDNVIVGNSYVGIGPTQSMNCLIERNLIVSNGEVAIKHTNSSRGIYRLDTPENSVDKNPSHWIPSGLGYWIWNAEHIVRNNIFAYNAGLSGWLDVTEAPYQWPSSLDAEMQGFIAEQRESMQLRHENNFFAPSSPSSTLLSGIFSGQNRSFNNLEALHAVRPDLEAGSRVGSITFANRNALDFRIPANSEALQMGCYPQGDVPGVTLGILPPDANLEGLTINGKTVDVAGDNMTYSLPCGTNTVTIRATTQGTVSINGQALPYTFTPTVGKNTLDLVTLSLDASQTKTYTLNLIKPIEDVVVQVWDGVFSVINIPANNGGYSFTSYQWQENGINMSGETKGNLYLVNNPNAATSVYSVLLTTSDGKEFLSCPAVLTPQPEIQLRVYPNPVQNSVIVESSKIKAGDRLTIFDASGHFIQAHKATGNRTEINLSGLMVGTYILKVNNEQAKLFKN
jgi:hypothetical protein